MSVTGDKKTDWDRKKIKAARLSIGSNSLLIVIKLIAGVWMSSVSVISEAVHSGVDLVAAVIATYAVVRSAKPPDESHRFGHGKFENVSGAIESILIIAAAGIIIYESIRKAISSVHVELLEVGLAIMATSAIVNFFVSRKLMAVAKETDSIALEADALHLKADVLTSLGVFGALGAIFLTGVYLPAGPVKGYIHYLDPIVATCVALFILHTGWRLTQKSVGGLLDGRLSDEEEAAIKEILNKFFDQYVEFHALRHRRSGSEKHIDLHLVVARDATVGRVHDLCDQIEKEMAIRIPNAKILIHAEPCQGFCERCLVEGECEQKS
jgi:cation diffusion facilitator family transporter